MSVEQVKVEGEETPSTALEIASFPSKWEKLTYAAGLGADIILSGEIASRKRELALVAYNVVGFAAGQVLGANAEAVTDGDESELTDVEAGKELRLISSRVPASGSEAITVPPFIRKALVKWAIRKLEEFADQFLGA